MFTRSLAFVVAAAFALAAHADLLQIFTKDQTSRSVELKIIDTAGLPATGLTFASGGIDLEYCREGAACTDITEVTQTVGGAWTSGGFVHKGHGVYRLDVPNAAFATGVNSVNIQGTITGNIVMGGTVKLIDPSLEVANLPANITQLLGSAIATPTITGVLEVDPTHWLGSALATPTTAGVPEVDVTFWNGIAATLSMFGVDAVGTLSGTHTATTADLGTSAPANTIVGHTLIIPTHNFSGLVTAYNTGTGVATFRPSTASTLANGNAWVLLATPNTSQAPQQALLDTAFLNCTVNTAFFAGSTTTLSCILTDRDGTAVTVATNDLTGLEVRILSGAQQFEGRFINSTSWDAGNSELHITLSRALPATLADDVTALIR